MNDTIIEPNKSLADKIEEKPRLGFGDLWNMNFGYLGIQFGWGLQGANMAAIYTKLGAHPDKILYLILAGPITGLLIQPIIGAMSDRTWSPKYGRRRPYFTVGAILASIALFLMPASPALWVAATLLWLLDASINTSMEPFRAFVADKLPLSQRAQGFLMQSFFIGLGASLATAMPWLLDHLGVHGEASNGIPLSVFYSFRVGAFAFLAAVLWTVLRTPESPPMDMTAFQQHRRETSGIAKGASEIWHAILAMPITMRQLFGVQFFTWFGLSCAWSLLTLVVAKNVWHTTSGVGPNFDHATEWAGVCSTVGSVVTFLAAPLMIPASVRMGRPRLYALTLLLGGLGILWMATIHSKNLLLAPEVLYGISWASIIALPYAILSIALPPERVGVYMGIFNFFIVLPQAIFSGVMPSVIRLVFHQDPVPVMIIGGVCFLIAAALALRVKEVTPVSALEPATGEPNAPAATMA